MTAKETGPKSGINFVCSCCGRLVYHIGSEPEPARISSSKYPKDSIFAGLKNCAGCGHELNFEIDPNYVKVMPATHENQSVIRDKIGRGTEPPRRQLGSSVVN